MSTSAHTDHIRKCTLSYNVPKSFSIQLLLVGVSPSIITHPTEPLRCKPVRTGQWVHGETTTHPHCPFGTTRLGCEPRPSPPHDRLHRTSAHPKMKMNLPTPRPRCGVFSTSTFCQLRTDDGAVDFVRTDRSQALSWSESMCSESTLHTKMGTHRRSCSARSDGRLN